MTFLKSRTNEEYQSVTSLAAAKERSRKKSCWLQWVSSLPYFDMARMQITDPMNTYLLGMVQNELKICLKRLPDKRFGELYRCIKSSNLPNSNYQQPSSMQMDF